MKDKKSLVYLRAKKKVEMLKGFYGHLMIYVILNVIIILVSANFFGHRKASFSNWEIYITTFLWGIGLVSHALYVFFNLYFKNNFLKRWEEKKIQQFLKNDSF